MTLPTPVNFPSPYNHSLRVLDDAGTVVATSDVALGAENNARRVRKPIAILAAFGFRVEVFTRDYGWERRRVVRNRDGVYLLRMPSPPSNS